MKPHGLLLVDKPSGMTSHDVVDRVRKVFGIKEVGHSGTLDPIASGLMVLLLGEGTKLSQYILERNKSYEVKVQLGVETDSWDRSGEIVKESNQLPVWSQVEKEVSSLVGKVEFPIPIYSAKKIEGKKLYEYAHAGQSIEVPKKTMEFFNVQITQPIDPQMPQFFSAKLSCAKGGFIRSWVQVLGQNLGCGANVFELRRLASEPFSIEQAVSLEDLQNNQKEDPTWFSKSPSFVPLFACLPHFKVIRVSGQSQHLIANGQISHDLRAQLISSFRIGVDEGVKIMSQSENRMLALVGLEQGKGFVIKRVFLPV